MTILDRIQILIDEKAQGNLAEFARITGIKDPTIRSWLSKGHVRLTSENLNKICESTGTSADWLLTGKTPRKQVVVPPPLKIVGGRQSLFAGNAPQSEAYYPIPLVSGSVAAGTPSELSEDEIDDWIPAIYHKDWCPHPEKTICVRVRGVSMWPTIPDGGLVAIDLAQADAQKLRKKIVAVRRDGGVTIKRLFQTDEGNWIARPDNNDSVEIFVLPEPTLPDAILGKVVWWWGRQ
ncbi:MAG: helix-turn-helix transcriptional regulator [Deltaproteobacteria bacterium]|nr:helix-turn-helix transcriptional regulator [Deltaproteobacteria bacterium]